MGLQEYGGYMHCIMVIDDKEISMEHGRYKMDWTKNFGIGSIHWSAVCLA